MLAPNGNVIGVPHDSNSVLIVNPETNQADTTTITGISGSPKFMGGVLASNGLIYCIPRDASYSLIINPGC